LAQSPLLAVFERDEATSLPVYALPIVSQP